MITVGSKPTMGDLVPQDDLPGGAALGAAVPADDLPMAATLKVPIPKASAKLTPMEAERQREAIEGPAPELADAPVANAVMAGALTGGLGAIPGAARGITSALVGGADFGVQQGLQDWVDKLLGGPLKNHPYLREVLSTAGGLAAGMALPSAGRLPGLRTGPTSEEGANILEKIAQKRAIDEPEEVMAGTHVPPMEGASPKPFEAEPATPEEPDPAVVAHAQKENEWATRRAKAIADNDQEGIAKAEAERPEIEASRAALREKEPQHGPQPTAQPKEELRAAVEKGDQPAAKEALQQELERHPSATVYDMRIGDMKRDPERFQYKTATDKTAGADGALSDIQTYDRGLGGVITTYHDQNGEFYVANGHGRAAALEHLEGPDATHRTQIIESRPPDDPQAVKGAIKYGYTPEQARAYGAVINIAEGHGTAMDAAKFFRSQGMDTKSMQAAGIALNPIEEKTQRAVALSRLSGTVFRAVEHGVIPEKLGVAIGRELGDSPTAQDGLYAMMKKGGFKDMSAAKLGEMLRLAKGSGETVEKSMTLFGAEEMKKSLISEQADVLNGIKGRLRGEKKLFGTVAEGAGKIEEAGVGKVDPETGERLSNVAAQNLDLLGRTAYSSGPVNDVIRNAAKEIADNPSKKSSIIKDAYAKIAAHLAQIVPEPEAQKGLFAKPEEPMTLGVGAPVVQAAERVISMLPEEVRNSPAKIGKMLQRTFAPETDGAFAQRAGEIQESKAADLRARIGSAARAVRPLREYFDSLPQETRHNLASQMEQGNFDQLPDHLKPFGPAMKSITDAAHDRLQRLTPDQQIGYVDNYWRHLWANKPEEVQDAFERIKSGSGKPLTGGAGFLQQRRFATMQEGIDAGLTPKFTNPVDQWLAGVQQEWRYATGKEMWNGIKDSGIAKFYRVTDKVPRELAKIDDSVTRVLAPTDKGVAHLGDWYVPKEVARIFNNYLSPGLGQNPFASISALGNRIRVEFSAFHFLLTSMSATAQKVGDQFIDGLGDIAHGNIGTGALKMALSPARAMVGPAEVYRDWRLGKDVISKAMGGHFDDPAVSDVILGGGNFDYGYDNAGHIIGDTWKNAFGIPQKLADKTAVIMKHWVAPLKVGTQLRLYSQALNKAMEENGGQELSMVERRTLATQVRRHVDNVMGQIQRDNLHFSNGMKDALHQVIAYPGWQIGTLRLMGGAARGIAKGAVGSKMDMQAQQALRFATGMIITGGTIGTLANYMMTGEMPKSVSEAFLWPTGQKDANGNQIRTEGPMYLVRDYLAAYGHRQSYSPNDVMAWPKAIGESALSKMNWPLAAASYIMRNANFFGKPIYFPDFDSQPKQIQKIVGQFLNEGGVPFSVSNAKELLREGKSPLKSIAAGAIGLTPESRALRQTPAQNFIDQATRSGPQQQPQSPDQVQRSQILGKFESDVRRQRTGGPKVDMGPIKDALGKRLITEKELTQRVEDSGKRPFALAVGRAPLPIALQAWKIASDNGDEQDEQDAANEIFRKIRTGAMANLPPDQQAAAKALLTPFLKKTLRGESGAEAP